MFDLKAAKPLTIFRITGRRRLTIYGMVIVATSLMFWSLVHQEHVKRALQSGPSDVGSPVTIPVPTLN